MFLVEYGFPVDLVNILVTLYVTKTRYSMEILNRNRNKPKKKYYIEIEEKKILYTLNQLGRYFWISIYCEDQVYDSFLL